MKTEVNYQNYHQAWIELSARLIIISGPSQVMEATWAKLPVEESLHRKQKTPHISFLSEFQFHLYRGGKIYRDVEHLGVR